MADSGSMADRGSGLPIMDCNYTDYRLPQEDDVGSQTGSDCSVTSTYLDWNQARPEDMRIIDNEGRDPLLQEGIVSAARGEPPAGTKFWDAAYCVENSNYGNTKRFGTGEQIETNLIDTKAHVLCLQECTEQHVERLRPVSYTHLTLPTKRIV